MADTDENTTQIDASLNRGRALFRQGQLNEALAVCEDVLSRNPACYDALRLASSIAYQAGRHEIALALVQAAIGSQPNEEATVYCDQGMILEALGNDVAALQSYDIAITRQNGCFDAHNRRGNLLHRLGRLEEALDSYARAMSIEAFQAAPYYNSGNVLQALRQDALALQCFDQAIALKPTHAQAHNSRGNILQAQGKFDEALDSYGRAIASDVACVSAYNNRGNVFYRRKQYRAALDDYERALEIQPDFDNLPGVRLFTKMKMCGWHNLDRLRRDLAEKIWHGKPVAVPFVLAVTTDDPGLQKRAAENYIRHCHPENPVLGPVEQHTPAEKIRLGYFSADFHNHATAYLMAELFERHDRERFELIAFSFGPDDQGEMRQRLTSCFDSFLDVGALSDLQIARQARAVNIDIAIDLKGHTLNSRTGIFAYRAAPIQVGYLGYPGTSGASYIDYLIADQTVIPERDRRHYSEKIVYLPHCYQVNDRQRRIAEDLPGRAGHGLPEKGVVFCCFNNSYKITPSHFDCWMRILKAVEGSVLWLLEDNAEATGNLIREAEQRGVSGERLVFAKRLPLAEHLARHRYADLFLDSLPCNAHTTASDALWTGLPVLTCPGQSFASRVAASLLKAIGLPELITRTPSEYEREAINLATTPGKLAAIRQKLAANRLTTPLFDSEKFTRHIEDAYARMFERQMAGLPPAHLLIKG